MIGIDDAVNKVWTFFQITPLHNSPFPRIRYYMEIVITHLRLLYNTQSSPSVRQHFYSLWNILLERITMIAIQPFSRSYPRYDCAIICSQAHNGFSRCCQISAIHCHLEWIAPHCTVLSTADHLFLISNAVAIDYSVLLLLLYSTLFACCDCYCH